jgi:membrane dipeptidase
MWRVFDGHCDVLSKLLENDSNGFSMGQDNLDVTYPGMLQSRYLLQNFAIFLSATSGRLRLEELLRSIDLFHQRILSQPGMTLIRTSEDLKALCSENGNGRIGAMLSLEGADVLNGNLAVLRILFQLGVRSLGITWNHANWAADGIMEPRRGGLTGQGRMLIEECNRLGMILDVSHLSERGFWELDELSVRPYIASHSNAYSICSHPRNLKDDQIHAIIQRSGFIGLTFVPYFTASTKDVTMDQLLVHIDHMCALGGERCIGFGSDFDGIDQWIVGLENASHYNRLAEILLKHYPEEIVNQILYKNAIEFYSRELPD